MAAFALSQRVLGRVAAFMFAVAGFADLGIRLLPTAPGVDAGAMVVIDLLSIATSVVLFALPWPRLPHAVLVVPVVLAFASIAARNWALGPLNDSYGIFFVMTFAWIGVTHRQWTSVAFTPLLVAAYAAPRLVQHGPFAVWGPHMIGTVGMCVIMGEALSYLASRLRRAEDIDLGRMRDLERLVEVSEELARGLDGTANTTVSEMTRRLLRAESARIVFELDEQVDAASRALMEQALAEGRVLRGAGRNSLYIPLMGTDGVVGVIEIRGSRRPDDRYTDDLARAFATQAALAFERAWATRSLVDASLHDDLTGLGNRRHASATLSRLAPGDAVVMIDLDHFKKVNDDFGHAAGDDALRALGAFLRAQLREGDFSARYGGEEFVLVLTQARDRAGRTVDRLREAWNQTLPLTSLSAGIAIHEAGRSPGTTLRLADAALYEAKRDGRDRVRAHTDDALV